MKVDLVIPKMDRADPLSFLYSHSKGPVEPHHPLGVLHRHGYVIELKYLKRGELSADEPVGPAAIAALLGAARMQLRRYLTDAGLQARHPSVRFIGLTLIFHGWELVAAEALGSLSDATGG